MTMTNLSMNITKAVKKPHAQCTDQRCLFIAVYLQICWMQTNFIFHRFLLRILENYAHMSSTFSTEKKTTSLHETEMYARRFWSWVLELKRIIQSNSNLLIQTKCNIQIESTCWLASSSQSEYCTFFCTDTQVIRPIRIAYSNHKPR